MEPTSEQELKQLLEEGKISQDEYNQLFNSLYSAKQKSLQRSDEPQFEAYRKRVLTGAQIICLFGLPIGIYLNLPHVWILSIVGIVVATLKLKSMRINK